MFSNQAGIDGRFEGQKAAAVRRRLDHFVRLAGIPVHAFLACKRDRYRKPGVGMWEAMRHLLDLQRVEMGESFYVGDAAGRPTDFSDPRGRLGPDALTPP